MITPISNNLNLNNLSKIERPRVPRKAYQSNQIAFSGKHEFNPRNVTSNIGNLFKKAYSSIKNKTHKLIHSNAIQNIKNNIIKGFHGTVNFIKNIPDNVNGLFKKISNKLSKKA